MGYTHRSYFGEQGKVGTSRFQHLSFIAAQDLSQATATSIKICILICFPKLHGRQHELQYFRADKRKTRMQVLLSTRGLH